MSHKVSFFQNIIKQKKPFRSLSAEAAMGLLITADVLRRSWWPLVEQAGVSAQQYNVLRILRGAGKEGLPTQGIAARLIEKPPGITRLIDQLESRGLVERRRSTSDRRQVFCTITPSGLELLSPLDQPVDKWDDESLSVLNERELKQLIHSLERIYSYQSKQ
ncbi:MAG: MarR family transcriptional regulator [Acidobacteria bacterium]|jgi:DNA-binding MarR family transcriptional regulator|nr:MarR family transcriptional regulator [Acidobacteriota bacterium]